MVFYVVRCCLSLFVSWLRLMFVCRLLLACCMLLFCVVVCCAVCVIGCFAGWMLLFVFVMVYYCCLRPTRCVLFVVDCYRFGVRCLLCVVLCCGFVLRVVLLFIRVLFSICWLSFVIVRCCRWLFLLVLRCCWLLYLAVCCCSLLLICVVRWLFVGRLLLLFAMIVVDCCL